MGDLAFQAKSFQFAVRGEQQSSAGRLIASTRFDSHKSIFHDVDINSDGGGTKVVLNTLPVSRYAVVPLEEPPRLLVTFTPVGGPAIVNPAADASQGAPIGPPPSDSDPDSP